MAEIINLRLARKRKIRADKENAADDNRQKHGVSTHVRKSAKAEKLKANSKIDAHILDKNASNSSKNEK